MSSTIFVTSATGNVGSQLVPLLLKHTDVKLVLATSSASKLSAYASNPQVTIAEGDITDPVWVDTQFRTHHVTSVFLCITGADQYFTTLNLLDSIYRCPTMKRLVYLSALGDYLSDTDAFFRANGWPFVLIKVLVEQYMRANAAKLPYTVVGPASFFSNDLRAKDALMQGMYIFPQGEIGGGTARVSDEDIGQVSANVLVEKSGKYEGKKIMVGCKKGMTDSEFQKLWSKALGKEVRLPKSGEEGLDMFENIMRGVMGVSMARASKNMVRSFITDGWVLTDEEYKLQVEVLGREAQSYEDFVMKTAKEWTS